MPTPPRSAILGVGKNKMQLNRMIAEALADPDFYIPATQNGNSLTIAGVDDVPVEITMGTCIERTDLTSAMKKQIPSSFSMRYQDVCKARMCESYMMTQMCSCFYSISMSPTSVQVLCT